MASGNPIHSLGSYGSIIVTRKIKILIRLSFGGLNKKNTLFWQVILAFHQVVTDGF